MIAVALAKCNSNLLNMQVLCDKNDGKTSKSEARMKQVRHDRGMNPGFKSLNQRFLDLSADKRVKHVYTVYNIDGGHTYE